MNPLTRTIPLAQATPGMVLAEDVCNSGGNILLPSATTLNEGHLASLHQRDVREISISVPNAQPTSPLLSIAEREALHEAARLEVQQMFRRSGSDPTNQALCKTVLEYRLEKIG